MGKKVTIQDIADSLGLSRNTVSKALNNTGILAEETRQKILTRGSRNGIPEIHIPAAGPAGT